MNEALHLIEGFFLSPLSLIFFIGGWIFVCFSLAKDSGWAKFKQKYRARNLERDLKFHSGSGKFGTVNLSGLLLVGSTPSALILKVRFPFIFGHPTLAIPWEHISKVNISENKLSSDSFFNLRLNDRITKKAFYAKYAKVSLLEFPETDIEVPWNDFLNINVPNRLIILGKPSDLS